MKRLALLTIILIFCFTNLTYADDEFITKEDIVKALNPVRVSEIDLKVIPKISIKINFKFDSTEFADHMSHLQLTEVGKALSSDKLSSQSYEIQGHTDSIGSNEYNLKLSLRRAKKIKSELIRLYSIPPENLVAAGFGQRIEGLSLRQSV